MLHLIFQNNWLTCTIVGASLYTLITHFRHIYEKLGELSEKNKELLKYLEELDEELHFTQSASLNNYRDLKHSISDIQTQWEQSHILRKHPKDPIYMYIHKVSHDIQFMDVFSPASNSSEPYYHRVVMYKDAPLIPLDRPYWIRKPWNVTQFVSEYLDEIYNSSLKLS